MVVTIRPCANARRAGRASTANAEKRRTLSSCLTLGPTMCRRLSPYCRHRYCQLSLSPRAFPIPVETAESAFGSGMRYDVRARIVSRAAFANNLYLRAVSACTAVSAMNRCGCVGHVRRHGRERVAKKRIASWCVLGSDVADRGCALHRTISGRTTTTRGSHATTRLSALGEMFI